MARAVIEIGAERTSLLVAGFEEGRLVPLLERRHQLRATRLGSRALATVVESEAAIARESGAASIEILIAPELRGSHLCRGLERRLGAEGLDRIRQLTAVERGELIFRGATAALGSPSGAGGSGGHAGVGASDGRASVATVEIGPMATSIAVGEPGARPRWWASRPLNGKRLGTAALRADPPADVDQAVAYELARGELATLKPPACEEALLAGSEAALLRLLCGDRIDAAACREARSRLAGQLSEIVAAQLDIAPSRARLLPALLAIADAAAHMIDRPLRIVHGGLAEGFLLRQAEEVGSHEPA